MKNTKYIVILLIIIASWLLIKYEVFTKSTKTNTPTAITKTSPTHEIQAHENPFFHVSTLDYQAPEFDKIKDSDFVPAFEEGMKRQLKEVNDIANNPSAPTFENTLVAMEKTGVMLDRVNKVFNALYSANSNPQLQKIQEIIAPKLAAHRDAISLNDKLFSRIKSIYQQRKDLKLDLESNRLVEFYYNNFVHSGANLSATDKSKLKKLNKQEASLMALFVNKLLNGTKAGGLVVNSIEELDGMTKAEIDAAKVAANARGLKDQWVIPLQNTTQQPALQELNNRETRKKLFMNSWNRNEHKDKNDTRDTIIQLAEIRANKAKLLGFKNFADWTLEDQMAKNATAVQGFLKKLAPATLNHMKKEAAVIQKTMHAENPNLKLQPWDWSYYAEKVRKQKYDLDESEIKPYFEINRVLKDGVFYAAHKLYGLTFKERHDLPVYQKDVRVFEVFNEDGSKVGLFYADYFKRDNKTGGAWMDNLVDQNYLQGTYPVIYNVTNFTKPAAGQPALISYDDVTTMFHEFGHALHGFFSDQKFQSLSGTKTARDWVEFPSQFNEHWASYPEVFANYAKHFKTNKTMPEALLKKVKAASHFNSGFAFGEVLEAADLDMAWHSIAADKKISSTDTFEESALKAADLLFHPVPPRYRSSYYMHIWANGYAAGYYAYIWTEMLDDDAYTWFEENGGLTRENGDRFRKMILSRGNTLDYGDMFRAFRGRDPIIEPLLKNRGLLDN